MDLASGYKKKRLVSLESISAFISGIVALWKQYDDRPNKRDPAGGKNLISAKDDGAKLGPHIPEYIANLCTIYFIENVKKSIDSGDYELPVNFLSRKYDESPEKALLRLYSIPKKDEDGCNEIRYR